MSKSDRAIEIYSLEEFCYSRIETRVEHCIDCASKKKKDKKVNKNGRQEKFFWILPRRKNGLKYDKSVMLKYKSMVNEN